MYIKHTYLVARLLGGALLTRDGYMTWFAHYYIDKTAILYNY